MNTEFLDSLIISNAKFLISWLEIVCDNKLKEIKKKEKNSIFLCNILIKPIKKYDFTDHKDNSCQQF